MIGVTVGFATGIKLGEFDHPSLDLANLLGEKPQVPDKYLKSFFLL